MPKQRILAKKKRPWRAGFNPRSSHTKDSKMVIGASLLDSQHYKVRIKGKVELIQGKELRLPLYIGVVAIEKRAF